MEQEKYGTDVNINYQRPSARTEYLSFPVGEGSQGQQLEISLPVRSENPGSATGEIQVSELADTLTDMTQNPEKYISIGDGVTDRTLTNYATDIQNLTQVINEAGDADSVTYVPPHAASRTLNTRYSDAAVVNPDDFASDEQVRSTLSPWIPEHVLDAVLPEDEEPTTETAAAAGHTLFNVGYAGDGTYIQQNAENVIAAPTTPPTHRATADYSVQQVALSGGRQRPVFTIDLSAANSPAEAQTVYNNTVRDLQERGLLSDMTVVRTEGLATDFGGMFITDKDDPRAQNPNALVRDSMFYRDPETNRVYEGERLPADYFALNNSSPHATNQRVGGYQVAGYSNDPGYSINRASSTGGPPVGSPAWVEAFDARIAATRDASAATERGFVYSFAQNDMAEAANIVPGRESVLQEPTTTFELSMDDSGHLRGDTVHANRVRIQPGQDMTITTIGMAGMDDLQNNMNLRETNWKGMNLAGWNLSGSRLDEANMRGVNLQEANLNGTKLEGANLSGAKLVGADLRNTDLTNANLRGADLRYALIDDTTTLAGATLTGANLDNTNLAGANMANTTMLNASVRGANLTGTLLMHADVRGSDFTGATVTAANIDEAVFRGAHVWGVDFASVRGLASADFANANGFAGETEVTVAQTRRGRNSDQFHTSFTPPQSTVNWSGQDLRPNWIGQAHPLLHNSGGQLGGADLSNTNLRDTDLNGFNLEGANLNNADLTHARAQHANLRNAYLVNTQLGNTDLSGADLSNANLIQARIGGDLTGTNLSNAKLMGADLRRANLDNTNLSNANLNEADLRNNNLTATNLSGANLSGAILIGATLGGDMNGANLRGADLRHANLDGVDLSGADLTGAILTTGVDLSKAILTGAKGLETIVSQL